MRKIEINSGGIGNGTSFSDYQSDFNSFIKEKESVISSFKSVKSHTCNLQGGVGSLAPALSDINSRIKNEEVSKNNAIKVKKKSEAFIRLTESVDRKVAADVKKNRNELYMTSTWAKPSVPINIQLWYKKATKWIEKAGTHARNAAITIIGLHTALKVGTRMYTQKSLKNFILGNYTDEDATVLSFGLNILAGIFDVDFPLDIRDLVYDVSHWEEGKDQFFYDAIAVAPIIGAFKSVKYVDDISDSAKGFGKAVGFTKKPSKAVKAVKYTGNAKKELKTLSKYTKSEYSSILRYRSGEVPIKRLVYKNNNLDPNLSIPAGTTDYIKKPTTNIELMKEGKAPFIAKKDSNGNVKYIRIELHHLTGQENIKGANYFNSPYSQGTMVEISSDEHKRFDRLIHINEGKNSSFRKDSADALQYNKFRSQYWIDRAKEYDK